MRVHVIGKTQYNLDSVLKLKKEAFRKKFSKLNPNWEAHYEELQGFKKSN